MYRLIKTIIFLFILSILIAVHEFGHFIIAKIMRIKVEKFSLGFGRKLLAKKRKDTEYAICAIPFGGYVKLAGDNLEEYKGNKFEYLALPPGKRFWIIFFGPLLNYVLGFLCFWLIFFVGYFTFTTKVGGLVDGFGAQEAGIQVGDKIIAVDGNKVDFWEDIQGIIRSKKESSNVRISILRDNRELTMEVNLKEKQIDDLLAQGKKQSVRLLGITPYDEAVKVKYGPLRSTSLAMKKTWELTVITYKWLWWLITGRVSMRESLTGLIGMEQLASKIIPLGIIPTLNFLAQISLALTIFNLLPLPVLDGGHILFLGLEKIRGKTLGIKTERVITQIGLTLIITLAIIVSYNDILRLFGDKISKIFK